MPLRRSWLAQKSLLFPHCFAASSFSPSLLGSFLLWRLGAGQMWSAAGRLSSMTTYDFRSRFPTHAAPAASFALQQSHHESARPRAGHLPTPKRVTKPRDEGAACYMPVGLEGCCISKDDSFSQHKGGTRCTLWQLPESWFTCLSYHCVLHPVTGRSSG